MQLSFFDVVVKSSSVYKVTRGVVLSQVCSINHITLFIETFNDLNGYTLA